MSGRRDEALLIDDMIAAATRLVQLGPEIAIEPEPPHDVAEMTLWNLTLLGEAAKRVSPALRAEHPEVAWSAIARTRDVVVHHYEVVDWEVIRGIVGDLLPVLVRQLETIRTELGR